MAGVEFKKGYKRGFRAGEESVDEGLPGWFGTFADMMTLLFAFFVLLAAISTMDPVKLQEMANSTGKSLGSKIKKENAAELEGEYEKLTSLVDVKKALEESIKENIKLKELWPNSKHTQELKHLAINNYDKIIVLNEGEIVGQGTHQDLMNTCQIYQEMLEKKIKCTKLV